MAEPNAIAGANSLSEFRPVRSLTPEQLEAVSSLHAEWARGLAALLTAHLHTPTEVSLQSIEQPGFAAYAESLPPLCYVAAMGIAPLGLTAALEMDLSLAAGMIEAMLGGGGAGPELRELTPIDEHLLEAVVRSMVESLQQAWEPATQFVFAFTRRQPMKYISRLLPPHERLLVVCFDVQFAGIQGTVKLLFPALAANTLLRNLSQGWAHPRGAKSPGVRSRVKARMATARFDLELVLPPSPIPIRRLMALAEGQVLMLQHSSETPAKLRIAGCEMFDALAVRHAHRRGAQVQARVPPEPRFEGDPS